MCKNVSHVQWIFRSKISELKKKENVESYFLRWYKCDFILVIFQNECKETFQINKSRYGILFSARFNSIMACFLLLRDLHFL